MNTAPRPVAWTRTPPLTLLVDRDADTRKMYSEYLQLSECRTVEAEDGREALAKAIAHHPDVVVTETRLPGISGLALCSLLRQDAATRTIPIVVVTGDGMAEQINQAKSAGADTVLVKPCLPQALFVEIVRLLEQSAGRRERAVAVGEKAAREPARSTELSDESRSVLGRKMMLNRAYNRCDTTDPPAAPPSLVCPMCDHPLRYQYSHLGGVNERHAEQWDYLECPAGCGAFQYRQRTRKLRKV